MIASGRRESQACSVYEAGGALQARKRVAAMKADGAAMREQLQAGADIHTVGGIDLRDLEQTHIDKITKIQANVRGHLARKRMPAPQPQAPLPEQV